MNLTASSLHLPPVSKATTTNMTRVVEIKMAQNCVEMFLHKETIEESQPRDMREFASNAPGIGRPRLEGRGSHKQTNILVHLVSFFGCNARKSNIAIPASCIPPRSRIDGNDGVRATVMGLSHAWRTTSNEGT